MTTTSHIQINPDFYLSKTPTFTPNPKNPRYRNYSQIHFTAGDEQQFSEYRDYQNDTPKKITSPMLFRNSKLFENVWGGYQDLSKIDLENTFRYIFYKFKKGIYVKIHDNQLKVFLPFSNHNYVNEWSRYIKAVPNVTSFIIHCAKLQGYEIGKKSVNSYIETWYGNNCLVRPEFPQREGESGIAAIRDMFIELCKNRKVPDIEFFINKRDFPILKKDLTEPYESLYNSRSLPLMSHRYEKYYPILSMCGESRFADIPIPTWEDWARVSCQQQGKYFTPIKEYSFDFTREFSKKIDIAVFRGGSTGEGTAIESNPRLKIAYLSALKKCDKIGKIYLDAGIVKWNTRARKEYGHATLTTIDPVKLGLPTLDFLSPEQQAGYKYIINIPGHVCAYRLSLELSSGSVVLLVDSPYKLWFNPLLKPYVHYVPVKRDLSDIYTQIDWCRSNPKECEKIAKNALDFYNKYLKLDGILDYLQILLLKLRKNMGESYYNYKTIKDFDREEVENYVVKKLSNPTDLLSKDLFVERKFTTIYHRGNFCSKKTERRDECHHEYFVGSRALNGIKKYIDNFVKIEAISEGGVITREWVDGIVFEDLLRSGGYTFREYCEILLQVNLCLFLAQSVYGFIHYDLYPWNIIVKKYDKPRKTVYPYHGGVDITVESVYVPYIIDYGKSSCVIDGVRHGNYKISKIQDTLSILLSSVYSMLESDCFETYLSDILYLVNFITGTKYRDRRFNTMMDLKVFLKQNKKYDLLLNVEKGDLEELSCVDFISHIKRYVKTDSTQRTVELFCYPGEPCEHDRKLDFSDHPTLYYLSKHTIHPGMEENMNKYTNEQLKNLFNYVSQYSHLLRKFEDEHKDLPVDNTLARRLHWGDMLTGCEKGVKNPDHKRYYRYSLLYLPHPSVTFGVYFHTSLSHYRELIVNNNLRANIYSKKYTKMLSALKTKK
jgi:hypothetical protein